MITSEVSTGKAFVNVMVRPVKAGATAAGTRISGGCHTVLVAVVPSVCALPLVCVQVAPTAAAPPVPPAVAAVPVPHSQPHIGTEVPSGISAIWRVAVKLTLFWAWATPRVNHSAVAPSRAVFTV
ncbi:MAG TPA: hypothetical protein VNO25_19915 [Streptosporangiaceae bacterium]|nr:hypothetical protein [Streptosporangiaceae bacterium]